MLQFCRIFAGKNAEAMGEDCVMCGALACLCTELAWGAALGKNFQHGQFQGIIYLCPFYFVFNGAH